MKISNWSYKQSSGYENLDYLIISHTSRQIVTFQKSAWLYKLGRKTYKYVLKSLFLPAKKNYRQSYNNLSKYTHGVLWLTCASKFQNTSFLIEYSN